MAELDALRPTASATFARYALLPSAVGWLLQVFLGGIATMRALETLRGPWRAPLAKPLLAGATISNMLTVCCAGWEIATYLTLQDRSSLSLITFRWPDAMILIPAGLTALCSQVFMAIRCWRVIGRNIYFAILAGLLELFVLASVFWTAVMTFWNLAGYSVGDAFARPILCALWSNVAIDLLIVVVLTFNLKHKSKNMTERGINMVNGLACLAFETCIAPLVGALFAAVMLTVSLRYPILGGCVYATMPALPSFYLLSFIYCLEGTQAQAQRTNDMLAAPSLHIDLPITGITSSELAARTPLASGPKTTEEQYEGFTPEVHFSTWRPPAAWGS